MTWNAYPQAIRKHRQTGVLVVSGGIAAGAMLGGILASFIEPAFGWRSLFMVAGGLTIVALVVAIVLLPESIRFLIARNPSHPDVYRLLKRVSPSADIPQNARWIANRLLLTEGNRLFEVDPGGPTIKELIYQCRSGSRDESRSPRHTEHQC